METDFESYLCPPKYQTHLGASDQNNLFIVKRPGVIRRDHPPQGDRPDLTLRLPDELLNEVFVYTALGFHGCYHFYDHAVRYRTRVALSLVCRRFNALITPLLYRSIGVGNSCTPQVATIHLHRTLKENPSLRPHCRDLDIQFPDGQFPDGSIRYDIRVLQDFCAWLTRTTEVSFRGEFSHVREVWPAIRVAVRNMPALQDVSLSRRNLDGPALPPILRTFDIENMPNLQTLILNGIKAMRKPFRWDAFKFRKAAFTTLVLTDFEDSTENLRRLVNWPKTLRSFRFGSLYSNRFSSWSLGTMGSILARHKRTLETIEIGTMHEKGIKGFNMSGFGSLHTLLLSYWATGSFVEEPCSTAQLLSPNLEVFFWDFTIYDQHNENLSDFSEREEDWVRSLAQAATERGSDSKLREIEIVFHPDVYTDNWEMATAAGNPWSRMDTVAEEIAPAGITLSYSRPNLTKENYEPMVNGSREVEGVVDAMSKVDLSEADTDQSETTSDLESSSSSQSDGLQIAGQQSNKILRYFPRIDV